MANPGDVKAGVGFGPGDGPYTGTLVLPTSVYVNLTMKVLWLKNNTGKKCRWGHMQASTNPWWERYAGYVGGLTKISFR